MPGIRAHAARGQTDPREQAEALRLSEQEIVRDVMLKETVDGQFTAVEDVAEPDLFLASFESNALTGRSLVVSQGWCMQ